MESKNTFGKTIKDIPQAIFPMAILFQCFPNRNMKMKDEISKVGKKSKSRLSVLFCVNVTISEKLKSFSMETLKIHMALKF